MSHQSDEDFQEISDKDSNDDMGGFQVVDASHSYLSPTKKGFMQKLTDGVKVKMTNLYYHFQNEPKNISELKFAPGDCIFLGREVKDTKELQELCKNTIFFTYREFKEPIKYNSSHYYNDTCKLPLMQRLGMHN